MDDWDPMHDDFYNEEVNSYDRGAGSYLPKHQQPANHKKGESQPLKLYVHPLKENFTEASLKNIFSKFGVVTEVYIDRKSRTWAFVSLKTQAAAERAIRDLNDDPDFQFKVKYAREKQPKTDSHATDGDSDKMSSAEMNRHKTSETRMSGSQFIDTYAKHRSIPDRSAPDRTVSEQSENRLLPSFQFSSKLFPVDKKSSNNNNFVKPLSKPMNGNIDLYSVPQCCHCKRMTTEMCLKCGEPFCSVSCMIRGYEGHVDACIQVAPHSSQNKILLPGSKPRSSDGFSNTISKEFADTSHDYMDYVGLIKSTNHSAPNISNSYQDEDVIECIKFASRTEKTLSGLNRKSDFRKPSNVESAKGEDDRFKKSEQYNSSRNESLRSNVNNFSKPVYSREQDADLLSLSESDVKLNETRQTVEQCNSECSSKSTIEEEEASIGFVSKKNKYFAKEPEKKPQVDDRSSYGIRSPSSVYGAYKQSVRDANKLNSEDSPNQYRTRSSSSSTNQSRDGAAPKESRPLVNVVSTNSKLPALTRSVLRENSQFEVKLIFGKQICVSIVDEAKALKKMMEALQQCLFDHIDELYVGFKGVARRVEGSEVSWQRCTVSQCDPLYVRYVDFSQEPVRAEKKDLRKIPSDFEPIYPFAYKVKFVDLSEEDLQELKDTTFEIVFLKKLRDSRGIWNVRLAKKSFEQKLIEARNVRDAKKKVENTGSNELTENFLEMEVKFTKGVPKQVFVSYIDEATGKTYVTDSEIGNKFHCRIQEMNPVSLPQLKDVRMNARCLAMYADEWFRARIVSIEPLEVFYIDFGNTEPIVESDLRLLPDELFNIPPLAIPVKFRKQSKNKFIPDTKIEIIPIQEDTSDHQWIVRLSSESTIIDESVISEKAALSTPSKSSNADLVLPELPDAAVIPVNEVLNVQVMFKVASDEYYVSRCDTDIAKKILNFDNDIIVSKPVIECVEGMLCANKFDDIWSRAKIVTLSPLKVFYIDFGNVEEVKLEDLYHLPNDLKKFPPAAFKVHFQEPTELECYAAYDIKKVSDQFWKVLDYDTEINSHMRVLVLVDNQDYYGVIPVAKNPTFERVQKTLREMSNKLPSLKNPEEGDVCVEWAGNGILSRVRIDSVKPLVVNYVDFGFTEIKEDGDFRLIPDKLTHLKPLAFRMVVNDRKFELKENDEVSIYIIKEVLEDYYLVDLLTNEELKRIEKNCKIELPRSEDGAASCETSSSTDALYTDATSDVDVMNDICLKNEENNKSNKVESQNIAVMQTLDVSVAEIDKKFLTKYPLLKNCYLIETFDNDSRSESSRLVLTIAKCLTNSLYTGIVLPKSSEKLTHQKLFPQYLTDVSLDPHYRPKVGDLITAKWCENCWCRALVLCEPTNVNTKYKVAMVDFGDALEVDEVAPLHPKLRPLSNAAVYCEIEKFSSKGKPLKLRESYGIRMLSSFENGVMKVNIFKKGASKSDYYTAKLRSWKPTIDELGIRKMPIPNGSVVKITAQNESSNICHISLSNAEDIDTALSIMEDVAIFCEEAKPMNREPFIKEIVGVKYNDSFWRGQIFEKEDDKYWIMLLDRGIKLTASAKDLVALPEKLKLPFGVAVPVTLKDVPVTEISSKVENYMKNLISQGKNFTIIIEEVTAKVELKFMNDESYHRENDCMETLNEYLVKLLTPDWKRSLNNPLLSFDDMYSNFKFQVQNLVFEEWVVGSKMSLYLADVSPNLLSMVNKNGKFYKKLFEVNLYERLADYANTMSNSYVPNANELCIAKHEGFWHRAVCVNSRPNQKILLHLVDEGPIVEVWHTNIRLMIPEFVEYVATSLLCRVDGDFFDEAVAREFIGFEIRGLKILKLCDVGEYLIDARKMFEVHEP